jgi:hypothetical protein
MLARSASAPECQSMSTNGNGHAGSIPAWNRDNIDAGQAPTFEEARAGFEDDWQRLLPEIPEGAFAAYRKHRAFHAWKEGMWAAHCKLPAQNASGRSKCFCGAEINLNNTTAHIYQRHMGQQ